MKLLVNGAASIDDVPGLSKATGVDIAFAPAAAELARELPGTDILLGWDFKGRDLEDCWAKADRLKWIHWCGAGVDAVLFDDLKNSDVVLTNSRGMFDLPMAETVLGYMLGEVKLFRQTLDHQRARHWEHRLSTMLAGSSAAVYGVGSIGREIARLVSAAGVKVCGVGRTPRDNDPVFGTIYGADDALKVAGEVDWIIGILPLTDATTDYFNKIFFETVKPGARFINVGRGASVDEEALIEALKSGRLAGAFLDVFKTEPLPKDSPMWDLPTLMVSPHISGDYIGYYENMVKLFLSNLARYQAGEPLQNVVDKQAGFVSS